MAYASGAHVRKSCIFILIWVPVGGEIEKKWHKIKSQEDYQGIKFKINFLATEKP